MFIVYGYTVWLSFKVHSSPTIAGLHIKEKSVFIVQISPVGLADYVYNPQVLELTFTDASPWEECIARERMQPKFSAAVAILTLPIFVPTGA